MIKIMESAEKKRKKKRGAFDRLFLVVLSSVKKMVFGFFSMSRFI